MTAHANYLCIALLLFACLGCGSNETIDDPSWNNPMPAFRDSIVLQPGGTKTFALDSATILKNENFHYRGPSNTVLAYNSTNSEMLCFDYATTQVRWKLDLKKMKISPHRTGVAKSYTFHISGNDSIFFYDQEARKVLLFDTSGTVLKTYEVPASERNGFRLGQAPFREELCVSDDSIYIPSPPGRNPTDSKAPLRDNLFLAISIRNGKYQPVVRYPNLYRKAVWGYFLHNFYSVYSGKQKKLLVSYAADHSLQGYDKSGVHPYYAGSKDLHEVRPLRFTGSDKKIEKLDDVMNFITQRYYETVYYDPYRDLYYRTVSNSVPPADYEHSKSPDYKREPLLIIILNGALQKVGEFQLDANKYSTVSLFISKEGVCIPLKKSGDDAMLFDVFTPVKK